MAKKYHFKIDNIPHEWDKQFITGAEVRAVPPGIPSNMDLFIKRQGKPGVLVNDSDSFDLEDKGIEKFYTQVADSSPGSNVSLIR